MRIRKVSVIIPYDRQGRILVQDRRDISKWGEEWGWFGGGVEAGETYTQAVLREAEEELSVKLTEKDITHLTDYSYIFREFKIDVKVYITPFESMGEIVQREGTNRGLFTLTQAKNLNMVCEQDKLPIYALEQLVG